MKNVHPVYGVGIQTHDHWNMSLLPLPLDQGSRPPFTLFVEVIWGSLHRMPDVSCLNSFQMRSFIFTTGERNGSDHQYDQILRKVYKSLAKI